VAAVEQEMDVIQAMDSRLRGNDEIEVSKDKE
jgi:hypothetical protein